MQLRPSRSISLATRTSALSVVRRKGAGQAYFPNSNLGVVYRRYDGSFYLRRVTRMNNDPMLGWLPNQSGVHFSREDHVPLNSAGTSWKYDNSWSFRTGTGSDKSVVEVADSFAPASPSSGSWINGPGQYYVNPAGSSLLSGIMHGKSNGHVLGEDYAYHLDHLVYRTDSVQTQAPTLLNGVKVWSGVRMTEKLNSYTPPYGGSGSSFGAAGGSPYSQVIRVIFVHGNTSPSTLPSGYHPQSPTCSSNRPSWANHRPGQTSIWQSIYYAPNIGAIDEETWFDERYCAGTASVGNANPGYRAYISYWYTW